MASVSVSKERNQGELGIGLLVELGALGLAHLFSSMAKKHLEASGKHAL